MKIFEIAGQSTMQVKRDNANATTLEDPETGIETVVPKDPNKPGKIEQDEQGNFVLSTEENGEVDNTLRPGTSVKMKQ